ncbi:MAG: nucleotidyltransferase domain-containing protein [Candidatus Hydrogenedentes bacterium]|nr:nucleotidyltransferase domain-containing protein [Candidatus Hydrogenedentota bacterium]
MNPESIYLAEHWADNVKERVLAFHRGVLPAAKPDSIEAVCRDIAARFQPRKIVLFGSYAQGDFGADSDVDILVIMPFAGSAARQATVIREYVSRRGAPFPMDLLVRTPGWIAYRVRNNDWFIREILERGKVMYEATDG